MGNALYSVTKVDFRRGSRDTLIQRGLTYGYRVADIRDKLSRQTQDWAEVRLRIQALQPGIQAHWGLLFLLRVLDEGLSQAAWERSHFSPTQPFPKLESTIAELMGGHENLWSEEAINQISEEILSVWLPEVLLPPEPLDQERGVWPENVELTMFVPSYWVDGLEHLTTWESQAWPDSEAMDPAEILHVPHPRPAEIRLIEPNYFIDGDSVRFKEDGAWHRLTETLWDDKIRDVAWDHEGNLCLVNDEGLYQLSSDFTLFEEREHTEINLEGKAIFANDKGEMWLGNKDGVHQFFPNSRAFISLNTNNGFPSNYIREFVPATEGRFLVMSSEGVSAYHKRDGFVHYPSHDDLAAMTLDGSTWSGSKWSLKFHPKDTTETARTYTHDHGIDDALYSLIPLPDNSILVVSVGKEIKRVTPNEQFLESYTWLNHIAPEGIVCGTMTEDRTVWLITRNNHLVKLQEGLPARLYVWSSELPIDHDTREKFTKIRVAPDGSLYLIDSMGVCVLTKESLEQVDHASPANQERLHAIPLQIFGTHQQEQEHSRHEWMASLEEEASHKKPFYPKTSVITQETKLPPPLPQNKERLRRLIESFPIVKSKDWEEMYLTHQEYQESGGRYGAWDTLEVAGFLVALFDAPASTTGTQLNLARRALESGCSLVGLNLSVANLSSSLLEDFDFTHATLRNCLFADAFLSGSDFSFVDAQFADFSRADLQHACFHQADLRNANFAFADLRYADFRGSQLEGAIFTGAYITGAKFEDEL